MNGGEQKKIRRAILLGRKEGAADALSFLLEQGVTVPLVVAQKDELVGRSLAKEAQRRHIPVFGNTHDVYALLEKNDPLVQDIDLVISFLFWQKIREPVIKLGKQGCINFHPAPLPDYKGRAGYNTAVLDCRKTFGVSAHFIDAEEFDTGPIIEVLTFPLDTNLATALSLERESQKHLLSLFKKVLNRFIMGLTILTTPNIGGLYLNSVELEALKQIDPENDSAEEVERKIRAFFFPPHHGAKITIQGKSFTLIDEKILKWLADILAKRTDV